MTASLGHDRANGLNKKRTSARALHNLNLSADVRHAVGPGAKPLEFRARSVVLGCGGSEGNPARHTRIPNYKLGLRTDQPPIAGSSIGELATNLGIDTEALEGTVAEYNRGSTEVGVDRACTRRPREYAVHLREELQRVVRVVKLANIRLE